jgi:methylmalonyl-CoA mutase cobalamin-binding subunit
MMQKLSPTGAVAMTDLSIAAKLVPYKPKHKVRFVTATSLFDGHDASINIMRRILQATGAEVIHLGHNRSVEEIVNAACRKTCRASPCPPTRAATSSSSST